MTFNLAIPTQLSIALGPDLLLMLGAMVLLLFAAWRDESAEHQRSVGVASLVLTVITLVATIWYLYRGNTAGPGPIAVDNFRWMADIIILLGAGCTIALSIDDNERKGIHAGESHVLVLLAASGMMLLVAARDMMIVFLGIEVMSISIYCLAGINRRSARGAEGALKYFLLGAFSTAFLLYGIALVYGATGATNLSVIGERIVSLNMLKSPILLIGMALMLVGFGFKVSTVPFHMWAPDVYDGSPSPITAFMAASVKAAAFVAFLRIWLEAFPAAAPSWHLAMAGLAAATMIIGNAIGLAQRNVKRMLAYSSIGHAGYLLVAIVSSSELGASAMLFYLLAYTLATFAAFGIVTVLEGETDKPLTLDDFAGLWTVRPWLAVGMTVAMLSLMGFPVFGGAGFMAKWYVLQAALQAPIPQVKLAVVLVLTTVISAGYYLYMVMVMFMRPRGEGVALPRVTPPLTRVVIVGAVLLVLYLGVNPNWTTRAALAGTPVLSRAPVPVTNVPAGKTAGR